MFKFNFSESKDVDRNDVNETPSTNEKEEEIQFDRKCEEVIPIIQEIENYAFKSICVENTHILIRDLLNEKSNLMEDEFLMKYYKSSDVTPSVYEGGLKVWECTYDLLLYLLHNEVNFHNKTVLDLGCGCGLLGIYAAQKHARDVHFHDYNTEVLTKFTIPNVVKNCVQSNFKFFSGDWGSFYDCHLLKDVFYDYILSSETLYNTNNYSKLYRIFTEKLKPGGEILLASKSYYFGVGGSTKQFQEYLNREGKFNWHVVWKNVEGVQREIMSITMK